MLWLCTAPRPGKATASNAYLIGCRMSRKDQARVRSPAWLCLCGCGWGVVGVRDEADSSNPKSFAGCAFWLGGAVEGWKHL